MKGKPGDRSNAEGDSNISPGRREWAENHIGPVTRAWLDEDEKYFFRQSLSTPCLNALQASSGSHLVDVEGRYILDFHGNSVHQLGYGHPKVVTAVKAALDELPFSPRRYTNRFAIGLASRLSSLAPMDEAKVLFAPSGAAAISMALKLARYATGRHKTVSMWDAFHGANLDAIAVGGEAIFRADVGPLLPGTEHVPPPGMAARFFGADGRAHERLADYIDYVLDVQGDVAAVLAEPMRWTTVESPPPGFWERVRRSCDRHGTLLIFDEIPSCLARTGTMFMCEQVGAVPDILVIGKGLGGGIMPMAAMIGRGNLDVVPQAALGHYTHEKSSVGCAAALATLDVIAEERLVDRARQMGEAGLSTLRSALGDHPAVRDVRGAGLYFGVELRNYGGQTSHSLADGILYSCLSRGLSFKTGGGNVLTLCPPLTISEEDLGQALNIVIESIAALEPET
ncbi:aspartate aminotransferase family protein [Aestuariivirga sp.]|uniref:(R)-1-hydroxy-2-aminoethylphosphonate ammonia-lyase n=1 Tax=Aestuariivirga sp. TaxID=2650926 RepID=UPI00391A5476